MVDIIIYLLAIITIVLLIRLSWTDIRSRIISNNVVLSLLFVIMPLTWLTYEQIFIIPALITLVIGFILFSLGVIGAGDVKLIAVLMLSIPSEQAFSFLFFTSLAGLLLILVGWIFFRKSIKSNGLPYGVAISLGFLINFVLFNA